jgi:hypothetical protein
MEIIGKITGIKYKVFLCERLKIIDIENFDVNNIPSYCILKNGEHSFAVSKWISPKRTRSYPFEEAGENNFIVKLGSAK